MTAFYRSTDLILDLICLLDDDEMARKHSIVTFQAEVADALSRLKASFSPQRMTAMNRFVGNALVLNMADYILKRSKTRHKTADRLGAARTGTLEFRVSNPAYTRRGGKIQAQTNSKTADVVISGVAGITRAFHKLVITPKKAKALTIPVAAESYANSARRMESHGWHLFSIRRRSDVQGEGLLMGTKGGVTKPLFALRKRAVVRADPHLLPRGQRVADWASAAIKDYMVDRGLV